MGLLTISNVKKRFGGNVVLDGVDMDLEAGKIYQLIGSNGSGKTTLINMISGLFNPDSGSIVFDGHDITTKGLYKTYATGLIRTWQIPQPFGSLTTLENVALSSPSNAGESFMYAALRSRWKNEERGILNKSVGIIKNLNLAKGAEIPSRNLSGGQKKLLELGRSTMSGARMILLDEPIAGVNPTLAIEIFERITEICKSEGITFLIVEHRLDIALQYTDTVFALNLGKIIAKGTPDEVTSHPEVIRSYLGG